MTRKNSRDSSVERPYDYIHITSRRMARLRRYYRTPPSKSQNQGQSRLEELVWDRLQQYYGISLRRTSLPVKHTHSISDRVLNELEVQSTAATSLVDTTLVV